MARGSRLRQGLIIGLSTLSFGLVGISAGFAHANEPVVVTSSGPASVTASSLSSTGRILATFTVTDTSLTATGATICRSWGEKKRQACDYNRFDGQVLDDEDDYWDDEDYGDEEYSRWDIVGIPGQWTVSYPIGFEEISREECITAAWSDKPGFAATMEVLNNAGVVLATNTFNYKVICTGVEGGSTGPEETRVYAARATVSKPFNFYVIDTKRVLKSYRVCRYNSISGKYANCDREKLTKSDQTKEGWGVSYNLTWQALGSSACTLVDRKWPQSGIRVEFYDASLDKIVSLFRGTRLDC